MGHADPPRAELASRLRLARLILDVLAARRDVNPCLLHTSAHLDDESMSDYLPRDT
jgi:hypothetical protein